MGFWEWTIIASASLATFFGLACLEAPIWVVSIAALLSMAALQISGLVTSVFLLSSFWIILIFAIIVFNIPAIRQKCITQFIFRWFKAVSPPISRTERDAIEAGDIWWEGELFRGRPDWNTLLSFPKPALTDEELQFIEGPVEALCQLLDEWSITHVTLDLPEKAWLYLKEKGFFGMIIPKQYGGLGFSALAHSTIVQKIATHSLTTAITAMVPNSLGPGELLMAYGTEAQKNYYLPRLAKGIDIPCFGLTGPEAGSDAGAIPDVGIVCRGEFEGKSVIGMKLTWNKRYITLAPVATVLGLAFKLQDPEKLLSQDKEPGITVCLLPTNHPGVEIGKRHFPLNQPFMNGPTEGNEVFVPIDWIIGGPKMAGKGWRMLVECLSAGRGISLPALSTAASKIGYRTTGAYAKIRKQFNASIGLFEGVEASLARIAGFTYLIESTRLLTLIGIDAHHRPSVVTAIAKYHITEMARQVVNDAMDIHGGKAIMLGPKNYLARSYESLPISITVEGANILTRNLMIFGQGAIRCHPYLQKEMEAANQADETVGLKVFDQTLFKHLLYTISNGSRSLLHALTGGFFCSAPSSTPWSRYYRQLGRMSVALAFVSDLTLMILGGKLKRRERLSARLGDVLSYLYLGSAVLKYDKDFGDQETDPLHVQWALEWCLTRIQEAFLDFFKNFPIWGMGSLLRFWLFPFGRAYCTPKDALEHKMSVVMMLPSAFRDRLTQHCYLSHKTDNAVAHLEKTLHLMIETDFIFSKMNNAFKKNKSWKTYSLEEKLQKALAEGIITQEEVEQIETFEKARVETIQVDAFSEKQLIGKQGNKEVFNRDSTL